MFTRLAFTLSQIIYMIVVMHIIHALYLLPNTSFILDFTRNSLLSFSTPTDGVLRVSNAISQGCPLGLQIPFCSVYLTFSPYNGTIRRCSSEKGATNAYVAEMLKVPVIFVKAVSDIVDSDKPTAVEFLQNLASVTAALDESVTRVVDFG
ncbi:5'-methylthioadenosine nucleosidase [Linum perenne]